MVGQLVALGCLGVPAVASAHGPANPSASKYQARVGHVPAGLHAQSVDGDLRLWLRVNPQLTVYVMDYRGAPYLRFSPAGVSVNTNSSMYYINLAPPVTPSTTLGPRTARHWQQVSTGHSYLWQEGRLQALAKTALAPGQSDIGRWSIPVRVNGKPAAITGELYHRPDPSIVWFWPILVVLGCVLAGLRLQRADLDTRMGRGLAAVALPALAVASVGRQLHGRPSVTPWQLVVLAFELAFVIWVANWLIRRRPNWLILVIVAAATLWQGGTQAATLLDGYVLLALPPLLSRLTASTCLATGIGLLVLAVVMAERATPRRGAKARDLNPDDPDQPTQEELEA